MDRNRAYTLFKDLIMKPAGIDVDIALIRLMKLGLDNIDGNA
jgi:hypothetical protein